MAANGTSEEQALLSEKAWLQQQNHGLMQQLASLQQQHAQMAAAAAGGGPPMPGGGGPPGGGGAPAVPHNPDWSEQVNPENGQRYFWNARTGESTYTRPPDFNPQGARAAAGGMGQLTQQKGPAGANLFIVRKMRRGEYDAFNDMDLHREFSKCAARTPSADAPRARARSVGMARGEGSRAARSRPHSPRRFGKVTRAEMTLDKETGWSKGFGFVSFASVAEADAALAGLHGSWVDGREMKVEKTKEDH